MIYEWYEIFFMCLGWFFTGLYTGKFIEAKNEAKKLKEFIDSVATELEELRQMRKDFIKLYEFSNTGNPDYSNRFDFDSPTKRYKKGIRYNG